MEERRDATAKLAGIKGNPEEDTVVTAELEARVRMIQAKCEAFKKSPDTPLQEVIKRKRVNGRKFLAITRLTARV
jgi:hypothetical protein